MQWLFQSLMFFKRRRFRKEFAEKMPILEGIISTLRKKCEETENNGMSSYYGLYNVSLFTALLQRDIETYSEAIFMARSEWHRKFHSRNLAVLLYEAAEDLPQLLGKDYRNWLTDIGLTQQQSRLNTITKQIAKFKDTHSHFLKEIRNYVGAHREQNSLAQLNCMDSMDSLQVYRVAAELGPSIKALIDYQTDLLKFMHNPSVMLDNAIKHVQRT